MRMRSTLGKLVIIGIALAILGITQAKAGQLVKQEQMRVIQVDQGLVKVVPAQPVASRLIIASTPPPARLSPADKQRLLQSVLTSLQQQQKSNPKLNLGNVFPISDSDLPSIPPGAAGIVLSPTQPYRDNGGVIDRLSFADVSNVSTDPYNGADFFYKGWLDVSITAVPSKTYLLDFTVVGGGINIQVDMYSSVSQMKMGVTNGHIQMEMGVTNGHILVPFIASGPEVLIVVSSKTSWKFFSVEIIRLN